MTSSVMLMMHMQAQFGDANKIHIISEMIEKFRIIVFR